MFVSQKGNIVSGDLVAGDKVVYISQPVTPLTRLYKRYLEDRETNELPAELYEKLQHFCNQSTDGDIRGLADKLTAANHVDLILAAERLKESAAKLIIRWQTSGTAQDILAWILGKMYTEFTFHVTPAIQASATREDVDRLISEKIIQPLENVLGENHLSLDPQDLLGLLFFLTGNCHIRWDKC
jgi:hypothetical protein